MQSRNQYVIWIIGGVLAILYAYALFGSSDRFTMTPFREAQTAITSYYMAKGESPFLAYEVPVLGQPWAVPMEFPLFQWLAAKAGGDDIDTLRWAGRLISFLFWLGCIYLGARLSRYAPVEEEDRRWFVLLLAVAPVFIAYGSSFLIESFTLFFALAYLLYYLRMRAGGGAFVRLIACGAGIMAALSKPTTWAPFAGVIVLIAGVELLAGLKQKDNLRPIVLRLIKAGAVVVVPMACAMAWVHFGDNIKLQNPIAANLTSESLARWNYGSLEQKLSARVWTIILGKQFILLFGIAALLVPLVLAWGGLRTVAKKSISIPLVWLVIAFGGYICAPIVFTNLHFRHDYYTYANGFFLIAALVIAISMLRDLLGDKWTRVLYVLFFASAIITGFGYLGLKKRFIDATDSVMVQSIQESGVEGPVIFFGFSWSSNMPYQLERRALMISFDTTDDPAYPEIIEKNKSIDWGTVAVASPRFLPLAEETIQRMELDLPQQTQPWPGMTLFSDSRSAETPEPVQPEILGRLEAKLQGREIPERGIVYAHSILTPAEAGEGLFELILRRGNDVFYLDGKNLEFVRLRNFFLD